MEIRKISRDNLDNHESLLSQCFPKFNLKKAYLDWLYFTNPLGDVVGFDAMDGTTLAAHYACIPTQIDGKLGLLSLNTATHPDYRSKGLYQKLAKQTFEYWSTEFDFVVGVANDKSAAAFVNRLGFTELGRLNLRYGDLQRPSSGMRTWTNVDLDWRTKSPRQGLEKRMLDNGMIELSMRPNNFPFKIKSLVIILESEIRQTTEKYVNRQGFTVDWIRDSSPRLYLPEKLKPSPLVMIYRSLKSDNLEINSWSFPDFDAF
jgi:hypothetical protein